MSDSPMEPTLHLDVEAFPSAHPCLDPDLVRFARAALGHRGPSPRHLTAARDQKEHAARVTFAAPDPRIAATYARELIVEHGAIVLAGALLQTWEGKQITRVCKRGSRVDYFVGEVSGDERWIMEVSGTDSQSHETRRKDKHTQLRDSFYRRPPHWKNGFVAVTRFDEPTHSSLDSVAAEVP